MDISKDNYVTILGFMAIPTEEGGLGLSGNELIIYAVLHGFSQDGRSWFEGTQDYLAEWCGGTTRTVRNVLNSLISKGFVEKREKKIKNVIFYDYRVTNASIFQGAENFSSVAEKSSHHINKDNYTTPSVLDTSVSNTSPPKGKSKSKSFVAPSIEDVLAYCAEHEFSIDPYEFFDHYQSNGWMVGKAKMKDWVATLRNWERRKRKGESYR